MATESGVRWHGSRSGLRRWQRSGGRWRPAAFQPITDAHDSIESGVVREVGGELLFCARTIDPRLRAVHPIRVWKSSRHGATWRQVILAGGISSAPVTLERAVDPDLELLTASAEACSPHRGILARHPWRPAMPVVWRATLALRVAAVAAAIGAMAMTASPSGDRSFADDVAFLKAHTAVVVLDGPAGARVAVCPAYQGRVMTSTVSAPDGVSLGWIHRPHVASGKLVPHINLYGGEDRFWLGPEGGQYSIFFKRGDPFDLEHWQTPAPIDSEPFPTVSQGRDRIRFRRPMRLRNYAGTSFDAEVERDIRVLDAAAMRAVVGTAVPESVRAVAFESENRLRNAGRAAWTKTGGLLSVWILGMFPPSPTTTVVVPFRQGAESALGRIVNDSYFGRIPADRLVVRDGVVYFRADGRARGKLGISPRRARSWLGSFDAARGILTLVHYTRPAGATDYVNSMWETQKEPFRGDAVNSYNDGPPSPGAQPLGPFYELETSSPAAALAPGGTLTHTHRTLHFVGTDAELDGIARATLGVGIADIRRALP